MVRALSDLSQYFRFGQLPSCVLGSDLLLLECFENLCKLTAASMLCRYRKYSAWPVDKGNSVPGLDLRYWFIVWRVSSQNSQPWSSNSSTDPSGILGQRNSRTSRVAVAELRSMCSQETVVGAVSSRLSGMYPGCQQRFVENLSRLARARDSERLLYRPTSEISDGRSPSPRIPSQAS